MSELLFALGQAKNVTVGNSDQAKITNMHTQLHNVMSEEAHLTLSQFQLLLNIIKSENVHLYMYDDLHAQMNLLFKCN